MTTKCCEKCWYHVADGQGGIVMCLKPLNCPCHQPKPEVKHDEHSTFCRMAGCEEGLPSPTSPEVKCGCMKQEIWPNSHFKGCPLATEENTIHISPASTEEWEKEMLEFRKLLEENNVNIYTDGVPLFKWLRQTLSSHDQQLRQRIVEGIKEIALPKTVGNMAGDYVFVYDFIRFITNL